MNDTVIISKELFQELVYREAHRMRMEERTHCLKAKEAALLLGCSERTLRNLRKRGKIKPGGVRGTYIKESILDFKEGR